MKSRDGYADKGRIQHPKEINKTYSPKIEIPSAILENLGKNLITGIASLMAEKIIGSGFKYLDEGVKGRVLEAMNNDGTIREMVYGVLAFDLIGS